MVRKHLPVLIADEANVLPPSMRRNLTSLYESLCFFDERILDQEKLLRDIVRENEACKRLLKVPGIGLLTATIYALLYG
jgi:transposase